VKRLVVVALFLEVGFLLLVMPWSSFWDRNYFAQAVPVVHAFITNNYVRGGISGLGIVNLYLGLTELFATLAARHSQRPPESSFGDPRLGSE
jgi:hypothetical protein